MDRLWIRFCNEREKEMNSFFKTCIITMILFTCIFTPALAWWDGVQDVTIFNSEANLSEEMPVLIDENSPFFETFSESNRLNVLLMGINTNLADTIMLVSYDMDTDDIYIISIPRDTYYPRPGYNSPGQKKINSSYSTDGPLSLAVAVSDLLEGIPINCYMKIEYDGVENIVDSMGGVPMNIPFDMKYVDPYDEPPLHIDIPEGYQVLDGENAVKFLRYRKGYPEGDIGRIKAQQEFMKSAFKQALGLNIISVARSVLDNVESDVDVKTVVSVAKKATNLSSDKIKTYTVPGEARNGDGGLSFWFADEAQIQQMLTEIYTGVTPVPEGETTETVEGEASAA